MDTFRTGRLFGLAPMKKLPRNMTFIFLKGLGSEGGGDLIFWVFPEKIRLFTARFHTHTHTHICARTQDGLFNTGPRRHFISFYLKMCL